MVHAETSTGVLNPVERAGGDRARARRADDRRRGHARSAAIRSTSARGASTPCYSCTQKCLGAPSGLAPVVFGPRALEQRVKCRSFYFDLQLLEDYWLRRKYHHTMSSTLVYALGEALAIVEEEGLEARWARHERNHRALVDGARARWACRCCRREGERLWTLNAVRVPDGVDEAAVRKHLLDEFNIEIGAGLGPLAGKIWRVGLMGASSSPRLIVLLRGALESALARSSGHARSGADRRSRVAAAFGEAATSMAVGNRLARAGRRLASRVLAYAYLTLPDVRPLRDDQSRRRPRSWSCARARRARSGQTPRRVQRWVQLRPHLAAISSAPCSSPKTMRSGSTRASTSSSCRSRSRSTGRAGGSLRGGSTITQQLAKNLYLSPSRNPLRKLRELIIARRLEAELKKARILELYLNVIEWGDGIYGVEAAARTLLSTRRPSALGPTQVGAARRRDRQSAAC